MAKVVVVDDYAFMRDLLSELLKRGGHHVEGLAGSGAELREGLKSWKPEIVILDIMLPDASGVEMTREVLAAHPKAKVLIISGLDEDQKLTAECQAAGAKGFLAKPFSGEALAGALAHL